MKLLVWNLCRVLRLILKKKKSVLAMALELEMGLSGYHFVEMKSAQINVDRGKPHTSRGFLKKSGQ